jgi:membrane-associated protease RseP (regulator of RpoE activity)
VDCREIDGQVVRLEGIADVADEFVRVRLIRISGADLNLFEFDYDLTWAVFFMNADQKIYGRYGGRDAKGPDTRNSLAGLNYAMRAALAAHRREGKEQPAPAQKKPLYVENYPTAKQKFRNGCIHCHQVAEIRREEAQHTGTWKRDDVWVYPLPETVGLTLEIDRGNMVQSVAPASPAAHAGLRPGDKLHTVNGYSISSFADMQYALHCAPGKGEIPATWLRGGEPLAGKLSLAEGWRKTNLTWRPSLLDILPSLTLFGTDLTAKEKKAFGLAEKRLAFRQDAPVHSQARAVGVQEGDIIIGIDDQVMEMTVEQFLGHVRRNFLVGERITLNVLRAGQRIDLPMKLK